MDMPEYSEPQMPEEENGLVVEEWLPPVHAPSTRVKLALRYLTSDGDFWNDVLDSASEDERVSNAEFNNILAYAHTFDIVHEFMRDYLRKFSRRSDLEICENVVAFIKSQQEKPEAKRPSAYREGQTFCYKSIESALSTILRS